MEKLKKVLEEKGMSVEEFVSLTGIPIKKINAYLSGAANPSDLERIMFSKCLGISGNELIQPVMGTNKKEARKVCFDGEKLKNMRVGKGLSRRVLAKEIGVSRESIDGWEHGIRTPNDTNARALEKYFEVSEGYFQKEK